MKMFEEYFIESQFFLNKVAPKCWNKNWNKFIRKIITKLRLLKESVKAICNFNPISRFGEKTNIALWKGVKIKGKNNVRELSIRSKGLKHISDIGMVFTFTIADSRIDHISLEF